MFPVELCHFIVEPTHIHMIFVVKNPEDVSKFMRFFKCETAHMLNGLLGRNKRTIWCEGFDSPIVLTPVRALVAIAYLYANPAKDNLTDSINDYEGFSSWSMFNNGNYSLDCKRLRRPQFEYFPEWRQNPRGYQEEADRLLSESNESYILTLKPNAWLDAFGITSPEEQERWNSRVLSRMQLLEERATKVRQRKGRRAIGVERLRREKFNLTHQPQRTGKRMLCLSEKKSIRKKFISFFKDLMFKAREVAKKWETVTESVYGA